MQYKTIVLELLRQCPQRYQQLRKDHAVLQAMDHYAQELKTSHETWIRQLSQTRPGSATQIASEALEIALKELEDRLSPASDETLPLDDTASSLPPE